MSPQQEKFNVTLKALREADACIDGYNKVVRAIQGKPFTDDDGYRDSYIHFRHNEPIRLMSILESNGFDDALWALCCVQGADSDLRLFAVWCARQVEHLMFDQQSNDALAIAERHANGQATYGELESARCAARSVAWGKDNAAAWCAVGAAYEKAADAVFSAAWEAAKAATWAAEGATARGAAWVIARVAQEEMFIKMCNGTAPWQSEDKPC